MIKRARRAEPARAEGALVAACVVAAQLGRNVRTIRRWIQRGEVSGVRIGYGGKDPRARWYVHRRELARLRGTR